MVKLYLITGADGFLGGGPRYFAQRLIVYYFPVYFPFTALFVNVFGSLLIGIIYVLGDKTNLLISSE